MEDDFIYVNILNLQGLHVPYGIYNWETSEYYMEFPNEIYTWELTVYYMKFSNGIYVWESVVYYT